jgi:hypothetical protein
MGSTRSRYCRFFIRILYMVIRDFDESSPLLDLQLTRRQRTLVRDLVSALTEERESAPFFQPLLVSFLLEPDHLDWRKTVIGKFCLCTNLQTSPNKAIPPLWLEVNRVTPLFAQTMWGFRTVIAREVMGVRGIIQKYGGKPGVVQADSEGAVTDGLPEDDDELDEEGILRLEAKEAEREQRRFE